MGRKRRLHRRARLELCEQRVVMTGMPVGDFVLERIEAPPLEHFSELDPQLTDVHTLSGVQQVRSTYGLRGGGQTVAVIDSGIAWDHWALGRGFGAGYRVVGGWDFTEENDANPYDDGPAGFHGTHVAGIIGSSDSRHAGVAPDVDLVALRVFNDQGAGYFHWVEQALQWVHANRLSFENPITVVNLSLGTDWNASAVPGWSMLEDEFAQLKADGIFISVAAGNGFQQYGTAGLSYPASSPHVVPVSSVTSAGTFSTFSQRHSRALAAPGQSITSTVPDHLYGWDGVANDFGSASGTSMAAPYVAGAAVLVREAMQFVGIHSINQDVIYDHLRSTADVFYDTATQANYFRINVQRAIDALMPADDFGSTLDASQQLGALRSQTLRGSIHTLQDADYFTFTADVSGTLHLNLATTPGLAAQLTVVGHSGSLVDGQLSLDVRAGQSITLAIASQSGIGHYDLQLEIESAVQVIDWGAVDFQWQQQDVASANAMFRMTATRSGVLSVEAFGSAAGNLRLELYDAAGTLLANSARVGAAERVELGTARAGNEYFLRAVGLDHATDFRLANLLQIEGSRLTVFGSSGDDLISYTASRGEVLVQGITYRLGQQLQEIRFEAGGGQDQVQITEDSGRSVTAQLQAGHTRVDSSGRTLIITDAEDVTVRVTVGSGSATLTGSLGDDRLTVNTRFAEMLAGDARLRVEGFASITANGLDGFDQARIQDTPANDTFTAAPQSAELSGGGYQFKLRGFEQVALDGGAGGQDAAWLTGSAGTDRLTIRPGSTTFTGDGYSFTISGFARITAAAGAGGDDRAAIYDSSGNDLLEARPLHVQLQGDGYFARAEGFLRTDVFASAGGHDRALLYDSAGNDRFQAAPDSGSMEGDGYRVTASGFASLTGYSTAGGRDVALLYDSRGDDLLQAYSTHTMLQGTGYRQEAVGFSRVNVYASSGHDRAEFFDSAGSDRYYVRPGYAYLQGAGFYNFARGFDVCDGYSLLGGGDIAYLHDSATDDQLVARPQRVTMRADGTENSASGFARTYAYASRGADAAEFWDSSGDDRFTVLPGTSILYGAGFLNFAQGFRSVWAHASSGRDEAVLYDSYGNDRLISRASDVRMIGADFEHGVDGFSSVLAYSRGGTDRAEFFDLIGQNQMTRFGDDVLVNRGSRLERAYDFADYLAQIRSAAAATDAWDEIFRRLG